MLTHSESLFDVPADDPLWTNAGITPNNLRTWQRKHKARDIANAKEMVLRAKRENAAEAAQRRHALALKAVRVVVKEVTNRLIPGGGKATKKGLVVLGSQARELIEQYVEKTISSDYTEDQILAMFNPDTTGTKLPEAIEPFITKTVSVLKPVVFP